MRKVEIMQEYSYQLYSSRNFGPLRDTLRMVAETGYAAVECFGDLLSSSELADGLAETGLRLPTAHLALDAIESDPDRIIGLATGLGVENVYAPFLMPGERPAASAGWTEFGQRLAAAGRPLMDAGLGFGWHNHDFEFRACEDGRMPIDCILGADERLLLELDIAWVQVAGEDPLPWIDRFAQRLGAVHMKDIAPKGTCSDEDGWADVGHGVMDWRSISSAVDRTSVRHRVIEHDNPSDDRRFAERSLASARSF